MMFIQMIEEHLNTVLTPFTTCSQMDLAPKPEYTAVPASLTSIVCADEQTEDACLYYKLPYEPSA